MCKALRLLDSVWSWRTSVRKRGKRMYFKWTKSVSQHHIWTYKMKQTWIGGSSSTQWKHFIIMDHQQRVWRKRNAVKAFSEYKKSHARSLSKDYTSVPDMEKIEVQRQPQQNLNQMRTPQRFFPIWPWLLLITPMPTKKPWGVQAKKTGNLQWKKSGTPLWRDPEASQRAW